MDEAHRDTARIFFEQHPELRHALRRSAVWPRVREEAGMTIQGQTMYAIAGDVLGGEEDLFLDRLARGARPAGADPLSRALFLELAPDLEEALQALLGRPA
jgi:hypothetical protein